MTYVSSPGREVKEGESRKPEKPQNHKTTEPERGEKNRRPVYRSSGEQKQKARPGGGGDWGQERRRRGEEGTGTEKEKKELILGMYVCTSIGYCK